MDLDFNVARAAHTIAMMQRALHGSDPWVLCWGEQRVPASPTTSDDAVVVKGSFLPACHLVEPRPEVWIEVEGEVLGSYVLAYDPGDMGFTFELTLSLGLEALVAP